MSLVNLLNGLSGLCKLEQIPEVERELERLKEGPFQSPDGRLAAKKQDLSASPLAGVDLVQKESDK